MRILLVDDEKEFVDTLAERLDLRGHEVRVVYNGLDGLAAAAEFKPDVAVLDWLMPGMSGNEMIRHLKERQPDLPVLLLTGHNVVDETGASPASQAAYACLTKPLNIRTFVEILEAAAQGRPCPGL